MKTIIGTKNLQNNITIINDGVKLNNDELIADKFNIFLRLSGTAYLIKLKRMEIPSVI